MSATTGACETRIKRCAVCKIDLKGRFVYIDDEIETLFGYSLEELFAQPFTSFLVESDHEIIDHFLLKHKHYESKFETTRVHIVNKAGTVIPASIIVSLSFAGGNPVNFQILISTDDTIDPLQEAASEGAKDDSLFHALEGIQDVGGFTEVLPSLRAIVGEGQVVVYRILEEDLELTASTYCDVEIPPETGALHRNVARTGIMYSSIDQDAVQRAIELSGSAPNECIAKVRLADGSDTLVRVVFAEQGDDSATTAVARRATAALQFLRTIAGESVRSGQAEAVSSEPRIDCVGEIGAAVVVIDRNGGILQISANSNSMFGLISVGHSWQDVLAGLASANDMSRLRKLESAMKVFFREGGLLDVSERLTFHDGSSGTLMVKSVEGGQKAIFAAIPDGIAESQKGGSIDTSLIGAILTAASSSVEAATQSGYEFGHRYFNTVDDDGNFQLLCLQDSLNRASTDIATAMRLIGGMRTLGAPCPTDLNLIFSKVHESVARRFPHKAVNVQYGDLAKIQSYPDELAHVLEELVAILIPLTAGCTIDIGATATVEDDRCEIRLTPSGVAAFGQFVGELNAVFSEAPLEGVRRMATVGTRTFLARCVLHVIGGRVEFDQSNRDSIGVVLTIPASAEKRG